MLHTPIYDVNSRAFCGPTAMSAVTGLPISLIRDAIRQVSGKIETSDGRAHPVMSVSNENLVAAMNLLGWRVKEHKMLIDRRFPRKYQKQDKRYTLREFLDYVQMNEGTFIVNVTGHYIAASEGEVCDTYTMLPIPIPKWKRGLKRWVIKWWRFEEI